MFQLNHVSMHHILGLAIGSVTTWMLSKERGETGVWVYQEDVLQGVVKHLNMTFFSGQEWVFQQDSVPAPKAKTTQEWLRRNLPAFISAENWLSGSAVSQPWTINWGLLWRTWHAESITTAWRVWGDPLWRQRQRSLWRRSVRRQQSDQSVSRLASRHRAAILSDIIINENLKLWQINYLARKVDVLFNFPSRSHYTWDRTYGKT